MAMLQTCPSALPCLPTASGVCRPPTPCPTLLLSVQRQPISMHCCMHLHSQWVRVVERQLLVPMNMKLSSVLVMCTQQHQQCWCREQAWAQGPMQATGASPTSHKQLWTLVWLHTQQLLATMPGGRLGPVLWSAWLQL